MSEIAIRHNTAMSIPDKITYAQHLAESNLLPTQYRKNPANLLFALEYAEALGVAPINAITSIHVIEGKPSASADLIASMVRKAGHKLRITGDNTFALAQLIRADDPSFTYESRWTLDDARRAGLVNKGVWKSYPGAMLRARAITEVARSGASDALFGVIYTPEELGAEVNADGAVIASASAVAPAPQQSARSGSDRLRAAMGRPEAATPTADTDGPDGGYGEPDQGVIDAEVVEMPQPAAVTRPQLTALNAGLTSLGYKDRPAIYAVLSDLLGRPITSSSDLTKAEASDLIEKIKAGGVPSPAPAPADEPPADEPADADWPEVAPVGAR